MVSTTRNLKTPPTPMDGTKPLPESMLTCHQWDPLAFIPGNINLNIQDMNPPVSLKFTHSKSQAYIPEKK